MSLERRRRKVHNSKNQLGHDDYIIKLRGISHLSHKDDIRNFLYPCHIDTIHLFSNRNNMSAECFVHLKSEVDVKDALRKANHLLGKKHIEVIRATIYEYRFYMKYKGSVLWREPVVRMNGLPYLCTMADVQNFFKGTSIARDGIYITRDMTDNALGTGYVAFVSMDDAYKAIDLFDQKHIQHRYIELSPSTYDEAKKTILNDAYLNGKRFSGESEDEDKSKIHHNGLNRDVRNRPRSRSTSPGKRRRSRSCRSGDDRRRRSRSRSPVYISSRVKSPNGKYLIKMRGMPYNVVEKDIREFFSSSCQPVQIEILNDYRTNRPSGDAHVYFNTIDEVNKALKYDRKYIGNRYVELYFDAHQHQPSEHRRNKSNDSSSRSSRSSSKTKVHDADRSQSESHDEDDSDN